MTVRIASVWVTLQIFVDYNSSTSRVSLHWSLLVWSREFYWYRGSGWSQLRWYRAQNNIKRRKNSFSRKSDLLIRTPVYTLRCFCPCDCIKLPHLWEGLHKCCSYTSGLPFRGRCRKSTGHTNTETDLEKCCRNNWSWSVSSSCSRPLEQMQR